MARKKRVQFEPSAIPGAQKAAYLLLSLGEEAASEVFRNLNVSEVKTIGAALSDIGDVSSTDAKKIYQEFQITLRKRNRLSGGGDVFLKNVVERVYGENKAKALVAALARQGDSTVPSLAEADPKALANIIRKEHPQTIALLLTYTIPDKAPNILPLLPVELQCDVSLRMASLDAISADMVSEIEEVLEAELMNAGSVGATKIGGVEMVAEIFNQLDKSAEAQLMQRVEEANPRLAEEIRKRMFVFDNLIDVDDRGIRTLLREVDKETLILALKTASPELREKFLGNMSKRAAEMIEDDLVAMGPVRLSQVERAQQQVVQVAMGLEEEGKLILRQGGGGGDALV